MLFPKNQVKLKEAFKQDLKKLYIEYMDALMSNRNIASQIDRIVIEGHTDSDGSYLLNLDISQKRAYAVMSYLASLEYTKRHNLMPLLVASGRSYQDIIKVNGVENKDASRRIEIKFTLKNDDAMNEIERILDYE
ncbi:MAG: OmpA family protein [Sulfurimonas sp.]|nr:OmpA family protein [Sulfurimonas sp.]